jgi:hypothetical protein
MDKVGLLIAALMMVGGFVGLLFPADFFIAHTSIRGRGQSTPHYAVIEHVTPSTARWYGLGSLLAGAGIAVYILWATSSDDSAPPI